MTTAPENYGNGSAKTDDRFAAQLSGYRPAPRRDSSVVLPIDGTSATEDLSPRNGSVPSIDRISGPLDRWFEAARSILELLYAQNARP
jgi:hypothetical protein